MKKKVNRKTKNSAPNPIIEEQTSKIEEPKPKIEGQKTKSKEPWLTDNLWLIGCLVVTAIAIFWRFYELALKPFHHDEGVNGFFMTTLFRDGIYKYDPSNYHGPTLYYIALAFAKMFGFNTISMRASVAIFGVLMVVMVFFLKDYIGKIGSLTAALFLALSPGMIFISRYFIHEIFFVFCSLGIVLGVLYFIEKRKAGIFAVATMTLILLVCFLPSAFNLAKLVGEENVALLWILRLGLFALEAFLIFLIMRMLLAWNDGRAIYLMLASASASLFFATKETAFITIGTMIMSVISVWIWRKIYSAIISRPKKNELEPVELTWQNFREGLGDSKDLSLLIIAVVVVFAYISVLFFSSFFTFSEGISRAFEAYAVWTKTGTKDHTQSGVWGYLKWGMKIESPIYILAAIGTLIALFKARHRFAMFTGFWAFGLFAAYSIIPYKTPWLALSFILPMCIIAGYGINELARSTDIGQRIFAGLLTVFAAVMLGYQAYDLNFLRYDDDSMPYVYAHTRRGFLDMVNKIEYYADKSGKAKDAGIEIVSPDYWPLTWYMKDYTKAIFHAQFADVTTSELIVASTAQLSELNKRYGANYKYVGTYPLRPGVDLMLLVRRDLGDADTKEITAVPNVPK